MVFWPITANKRYGKSTDPGALRCGVEGRHLPKSSHRRLTLGRPGLLCARGHKGRGPCVDEGTLAGWVTLFVGVSAVA
jgi:hypothetical protein